MHNTWVIAQRYGALFSNLAIHDLWIIRGHNKIDEEAELLYIDAQTQIYIYVCVCVCVCVDLRTNISQISKVLLLLLRFCRDLVTGTGSWYLAAHIKYQRMGELLYAH